MLKSIFFFCWVHGGFSGAHGQVTLPMIFGLMNHQALEGISQLFMVWAGIPAVVFFFFCGGGQLSYDLATLKQMVQANLVMLKFQSPQPGPHCTLMISLKRLGNKRNKLSLYLVEWACPELRRACWGFAGLHLEFYICACIYIYIKCNWSVPW